MEEVIHNIVATTLSSFDFSYCIVVNIATYIIVSLINDCKKTCTLNTWGKRLVLLLVGLIAAFVYYQTGNDIKTIFNSFILAPVAWSWIIKPICKKLNVDYSNYCDKI